MPDLPRRLVAAHIVSLMLIIAAPQMVFAGATGHKNLISKDFCEAIIARAERRHGIPARLLRAISLAETGRRDPRTKAMIAWPWAVNAGGKGYYFETKAKAMAAVRRLRAKGARNIDVGCMQVNLMHHPKAFRYAQSRVRSGDKRRLRRQVSQTSACQDRVLDRCCRRLSLAAGPSRQSLHAARAADLGRSTGPAAPGRTGGQGRQTTRSHRSATAGETTY